MTLKQQLAEIERRILIFRGRRFVLKKDYDALKRAFDEMEYQHNSSLLDLTNLLCDDRDVATHFEELMAIRDYKVLKAYEGGEG